MTTQLEWGSKEWRTHLRRSLAQRRRHGETITDMEGLIDYIEAKGPAKGSKYYKGTKQTKKRIVEPKASKEIVYTGFAKVTRSPLAKVVHL